MEPGSVDSLPWRDPPSIPYALNNVLVPVLLLSVIISGVLYVAVVVIGVGGIIQSASSERWLGALLLLAGLAALSLVPLGLHRLWRRCHEGRLVQRYLESGASAVWLFVPAGWPNWFQGIGAVAFHDGAMLVNAPVRKDLTRFIAVAALVPAVLSMLDLGIWPPAIAVACFVCYRVREPESPDVSHGEDPHRIAPEDIRRVRFRGNMVTLKLRRSALPYCKVRNVRFFVPPAECEAFFRDFDQTFPGRLPVAYRRAVLRLDPDVSLSRESRVGTNSVSTRHA